MKKILILGLLAALAVTGSVSADSVGSAFGTLTTAQALGAGRAAFGAGVGVADATSFFGSFTYGLSSYTDGRVKVGLVDHDGADAELTIGADFKWQFWSYGPNSKHPFDFAVGAFFEYADIDRFSIFQVGGQLIGSYPIALRGGSTLVPYGKFNARLESISWDADFPGNDDSESNLEVGLNGGLQWKLTSDVALYGEFQIDGNDGVFFGIDLAVI